MAAAATGCATATGDGADAKDAFADEFARFQDEFGAGKADLFGLDIDPCALLGPLGEFGDDALRMGLVVGVEGEGVLGAGVGFGGVDFVWDLYHQQMTVSRYAGAGIGAPGVGASAQAYVGAAFGFEHGVSDWDGYFVTATAEIGLPLLDDYVSLDPGAYVSAVDRDGDGFIAPSEVLAPPDGVYGFTMGVSLGVDLLPDPLPIEGSITEGYWRPYKRAIRRAYDELRNTRMFFVKKMQVRLVDHHDGAECPAGWPDVDGERDCVIEFGDPGDGYLRRAVNTAYSICHVTGRCAAPLTWPMSATALAIGALRDSGVSFERFCPDTGAAHH
ncbi:MAG: hypothetical protein D6689_22580 [Deltaproteobacteria bacterium]|nr:MAG: hypothetical protein D6689_22580 [Deltaproteobacteria bacterium]